jgi:hypothetical protein
MLVAVAALWRDSDGTTTWEQTSKVKIPTKVAYELDGSNSLSLIAWGDGCSGLPSANIRECFKTFMGFTNFATGPDSIPRGPTSCQELHHWMSDYLAAFCAEVISVIDGDTTSTAEWGDTTIIWNFTTPDCWKGQVNTEFKRLVEATVSSKVPKCKSFHLFCNMTEGNASAQALLVECSGALQKHYSVGNTVISCDIGGATTDIALSTIVSTGKLSTWPPLGTHPTGTVTIEKAFWLHARHIFELAGIKDHEQMALEVARGRDLEQARANFTNRYNEKYLIFALSRWSNVDEWEPAESPTPAMSFIKTQKLYIHR